MKDPERMSAAGYWVELYGDMDRPSTAGAYLQPPRLQKAETARPVEDDVVEHIDADSGAGRLER